MHSGFIYSEVILSYAFPINYPKDHIIADPRLNPYPPGAGTPLPELAGRDELIERAAIALDPIRTRRSARSPILHGLHGAGKTVLQTGMTTMSVDETAFLNDLKEKVFGPVARRVMDRADSLLHIAKFPMTGIEGWLKVEAVWALSDLVIKLKNEGPDLQLADDLFVELKGATDCNKVGILGGLKKYQTDLQYPRLACLFIGSGNNISLCVDYWNANARVVAYETFSVGTYNWIIGLIVPQDSGSVPISGSLTR